MTREQLESYRSMKEEITEIRYKLLHLADGDALVGNDVIMDYRSGYPVPQSVVGYDYDKHRRLSDRYKQRINKLQEETGKIEEFIENIPDSLTRRIFRMQYMDGMTQIKIAKIVNLNQGSVSKKITEYLKDA